MGKDGAERYRVHNLPEYESPGVYELAVAVSPSGLGRGIKADQIVPVYVGQADSARTRLQHYGRRGAHLGKSCSVGNGSELICKGPGLFEEMLARGYTIVYRWAPVSLIYVVLISWILTGCDDCIVITACYGICVLVAVVSNTMSSFSSIFIEYWYPLFIWKIWSCGVCASSFII